MVLTMEVCLKEKEMVKAVLIRMAGSLIMRLIGIKKDQNLVTYNIS